MWGRWRWYAVGDRAGAQGGEAGDPAGPTGSRTRVFCLGSRRRPLAGGRFPTRDCSVAGGGAGNRSGSLEPIVVPNRPYRSGNMLVCQWHLDVAYGKQADAIRVMRAWGAEKFASSEFRRAKTTRLMAGLIGPSASHLVDEYWFESLADFEAAL